ncbi:UDP-N-acetylmuramoylalanine--D-glutamate ligase [Candidatus Arthromitus sp. SFB-4]|nr:UDP-N-acetylmuramoylalanine--D-glutamate ligase [Candidatus Arthromitus sp. SFB-4]
MREDDKVVLELSSFQLMNINISPDISIITNISPNHLDYHKDMNEYIDCKKNIFRFQDDNSITILNRDCSITNSFDKELNGRSRKFSINHFDDKEVIKNGSYLKNDELYVLNQRILHKNDLKIKGDHNMLNFAAAILATIPDISYSTIKNFAKEFSGVKHRNEFVDTINNIHFYNDSIASTPTRTLATLSCFDQKVILIAGGYDKNISYVPLLNGYDKIKKLYLIGATKQKIYDVFKKYSSDIEIIIFNDFNELVSHAYKNACENDVILLSPASASFDMFKNFEERGDKFKEIIQKIKASK